MDQAEKLEVDIELKSSANTFYKLFSNQVHQIPDASDKIHAVEVQEGDWETPGSIKLWKYTLGGKPEFFKEKVEFDDTNKTITFVAVEGHILEKYKTYKATLQAIAKEDGEGGLVKIVVEYEKVKADDLPPNEYLDILVNVIKDSDAHLVKA